MYNYICNLHNNLMDKGHVNARSDIGGQQYAHENISLDEDTISCRLPNDDISMPTQELVASLSPMTSEISTSKPHRKRKKCG